MKRIVFAIGLLMAGAVNADDFVIHMTSHHFEITEKMRKMGGTNEENIGVGYAWNNQEIGAYKNTYSRLSTYWYQNTRTVHGFSAFAGVVTGYPIAPVLPAFGINYVVKNTQITLLPGVGSGALALSYRF